MGKRKIKVQRVIDLCVKADVLTICFYYSGEKHLLHLSNVSARLANVLINIETGKIVFENYFGGNINSKLVKVDDEELLKKRFFKEGKSLDEIIIWMLKKCIEGKEVQCIENKNFYVDKFINDISESNLGYFEKGISIGLLGKTFGMAGGDLIRTIEEEIVEIENNSSNQTTQLEFEF